MADKHFKVARTAPKSRQEQRDIAPRFTKQRVWADPDEHGIGPLHESRLAAVIDVLLSQEQPLRFVADLGCGAGALLQRLLAMPSLERVLGLDISGEALARARLQANCAHALACGRLQLQASSFLSIDWHVLGCDAVVLLETMEHVPPNRLSELEQAVFGQVDVRLMVVTTPNVEYNPLLGLPQGRLRHPDHCFEWTRAKFRQWSLGVALRHHLSVVFRGIGTHDSRLGTPTQMAVFRR